MELWRSVFRRAIVPLAPLDGLIALRKAVAEDSSKLIQGATTQPPPLMVVRDWPVEASDAIGFLFWKGEDATVGDTEEWFAAACFAIDQTLGEPAGCRHWLTHWDDCPRTELFEKLLPEIDLAIARKKEM